MSSKNETPLIPLEDFFRNPEKTRFQISPNGEYLSFMSPWENRLNVFTQHLSSGKEFRVTSEKDRNVSGYFWGSNSRIVFLKDKGGDENFHLYSVSPEGNGELDLTPFDGVTAQVIDDLEENEDELIVGLNLRNKEIFDAYRLNINTAVLVMEAENPGNITEWFTDHNGIIRLAITTDGVSNTLLYREMEAMFDGFIQASVTAIEARDLNNVIRIREIHYRDSALIPGLYFYVASRDRDQRAVVCDAILTVALSRR